MKGLVIRTANQISDRATLIWVKFRGVLLRALPPLPAALVERCGGRCCIIAY